MPRRLGAAALWSQPAELPLVCVVALLPETRGVKGVKTPFNQRRKDLDSLGPSGCWNNPASLPLSQNDFMSHVICVQWSPTTLMFTCILPPLFESFLFLYNSAYIYGENRAYYFYFQRKVYWFTGETEDTKTEKINKRVWLQAVVNFQKKTCGFFPVLLSLTLSLSHESQRFLKNWVVRAILRL